MKQVLILCSENSGRSQMAEGLINHHLKDRWKAYSAGYEPDPVHPIAIQAMNELGIDISNHFSKKLDVLQDKEFTLVITVCSKADIKCPLYLGQAPKIHIGFADPARVRGTEEEVLQAFRDIRDDMRYRLVDFLKYL